MRAYCIYLPFVSYSRAAAARCVKSAIAVDQNIELFAGVDPASVFKVMARFGLVWTWANQNTSPAVCPSSGLKQHPYKTYDNRMRIGCSMSHFMLWNTCTLLNEPILILEHDAVFLRPVPELPAIQYDAIMINDPRRATPRADKWAAEIAAKGPGIHAKSVVFADEERRPDGLAGNSAYIISPRAAETAIAIYHKLGVWPNDATLCRQFFPHLKECYPFVTEVRAAKSMAGGY